MDCSCWDKNWISEQYSKVISLFIYFLAQTQSGKIMNQKWDRTSKLDIEIHFINSNFKGKYSEIIRNVM